MSRCLLALLLLAATACRTTPAAEEDPLALIQGWEDRRSLGGGELLRLTGPGAPPAVRVRALRALARLQDAQTAPAIVAALQDLDPQVRSEAAFAAGQLGFSWDPLPPLALETLTAGLLEAEAREGEGELQVLLVEALGKLLAPAATARLIERLGHTDPKVRAAALLGLAMPVRRGAGPMSPEAQQAVLGRYHRELPEEERYAAAYALTFARSPDGEERLLSCLGDPTGELRALCARGLGESGSAAAAGPLGERLADPDARVASEAARALTRLADRCPPAPADCAAVTALQGLTARVDALIAGDPTAAHPILAFAQHFNRDAGAIALAGPWRQRLLTALSHQPPTSRTLALLDCRLAALWAREQGTLDELSSCGDGSVPEPLKLSWGLRQLGQSKVADGALRLERLVSALEHPAPAVRSAAFEVLGTLGDRSVAHRIRPLIVSKDPLTAASAAALAGQLADAEALPAIRALLLQSEEAPDVLAAAGPALLALEDTQAEATYSGWLTHRHANVRSVAAKLLSQMRGAPVYPPRMERAGEAASAGAPGPRVLKLKTLHGELSIRLFTEEAPLTSHNFYRLAQTGYFRGHTFHRIVPNFVVQDGDPRGDGEGGPGYSIRCELNRRRYLRGTVGVALSGKDTGGSQFFIAHSPQPHLDGRYTAFGEVIEGVELIDRLLEGDVVLDLEPVR